MHRLVIACLLTVRVFSTKVVVKPYGSWPDYVFGNDYRLRPLGKLEKYIKDNHHLPDIPSADSVAKVGVDIGAGQAALVEEDRRA